MRRVKEDMDSGSDAEGKVQSTFNLQPGPFTFTYIHLYFDSPVVIHYLIKVLNHLI